MGVDLVEGYPVGIKPKCPKIGRFEGIFSMKMPRTDGGYDTFRFDPSSLGVGFEVSGLTKECAGRLPTFEELMVFATRLKVDIDTVCFPNPSESIELSRKLKSQGGQLLDSLGFADSEYRREFDELYKFGSL